MTLTGIAHGPRRHTERCCRARANEVHRAPRVRRRPAPRGVRARAGVERPPEPRPALRAPVQPGPGDARIPRGGVDTELGPAHRMAHTPQPAPVLPHGPR